MSVLSLTIEVDLDIEAVAHLRIATQKFFYRPVSQGCSDEKDEGRNKKIESELERQLCNGEEYWFFKPRQRDYIKWKNLPASDQYSNFDPSHEHQIDNGQVANFGSWQSYRL